MQRLEDNIKTDTEKMTWECMDWIRVAEITDQWEAVLLLRQLENITKNWAQIFGLDISDLFILVLILTTIL